MRICIFMSGLKGLTFPFMKIRTAIRLHFFCLIFVLRKDLAALKFVQSSFNFLSCCKILNKI